MYCTSPNCASFVRPFLFRQLFDQESSTYTYLLADTETKEALLIDPVLEQIDRDTQLVKELGLELKYALNTHVHADHVTGSGLLRKKYFANMKSVLGATGNEDAAADIKVKNGEVFTMGSVKLQFRSTPGHTNGCHVLVAHDVKMIFTGDTVLIRGCGRTDFQQGNAESLYNHVWSQVFSLPEEFLIYPAHDYKGRTVSSVGEEKKHNPRLSKTLSEFAEIMKNLNLPYPKKIDISVPLNRVCGLHELLSPEAAAKIAAAAASLSGGGGNCSGESKQGGNCSGEPASTSGLASVEVLKAIVAKKPVIVDLRGDPGEDRKTCAPGAIHCPWNREQGNMPVEGLPEDKNTPMIVHCAKGLRAAAGIEFLKARGYLNLVNGGGPLHPALWEVYGNDAAGPSASASGGHCSGEPPASGSGPASVEVLKAIVAQKPVIVDLRGDPGEDRKTRAPGAIHCPWNREQGNMPTEGLPEDKNTPMIVHCGKGLRAAAGIEFLKARGYLNLVNGGGPLHPALWEVYGNGGNPEA